MTKDTQRNVHLIGLVALVVFVALAMAALTRQAQQLKPEPPPPPAVVVQQPPAIPPIPEPPVMPGATGTEAAPPAEPAYLSPEFKSADGVTSVVLRMGPMDGFIDDVWQTHALRTLDFYGTSTAFESTISWQLVDSNGREMGRGYMMLASPDQGIPGPYTVKTPVMRYPSTDKGTLRVYEASAKDGSPIHEVKIPIKFLCREDDCNKQVFLHFQNPKKDPDMLDCAKTFGVTRKIFAEGRPGLGEALSELLSGPTDFEKSKGYATQVPEGVPPPQIARIVDGVPHFDFSQALQKDVAGSCRVTAIRAQISETAKAAGQDMPISIEGNASAVLQP